METPFLRVSRPVSACSRCRSAKIKCDGKLPACSACERANRAAECSSANDQFAKGKERSYVSSLESRIERLEKRLAQSQRRKSSTVMLDLGASVRPSSESVRSGGGRTQSKEASNVDDLVSDFGFLAVNATARDYYGFTQQMSFAKLVLSASSIAPLPRLNNSGLPTKEICTTIVQDCVLGPLSLYPILSDTAAFGSLEAAYQQNSYYCTPIDYWNVHMMLAITYMSRTKKNGDEDYRAGVTHASNALQYVEMVIIPGSIAGVQATLLLVLYSLLDPFHFNVWYVVGVASRIMVDLGLHDEITDEVRMKESHLELRRRIFQCVYAFDRAISISHVRAFSFSDASTNFEIPARQIPPLATFEASFQPNVHTATRACSLSIELLRFRQIQSLWYQRLFSSQREALLEPWPSRCRALNNMSNWFSSLPDGQDQIKQYFLSEMLFCNVLVVYPPGGPDVICPYGTWLLLDSAIEYASVTRMLCDRYQDANLCTSNDVLRALIVGQRVFDILQGPNYSLFDGFEPQSSAVPSDCKIPMPKKHPGTGLLTETIDAITGINQILSVLGERFGYPASWDAFSKRSASALHNLHAQRQKFTSVPIGLVHAAAWQGPTVDPVSNLPNSPPADLPR